MSERLTATCPSCHDVALLAERIVVCEKCEAIYHDQCWRKNGNKCTEESCKAEAAAAGETSETKPVPPPERVRPGPRSGLPTRVQSGTFTAEGIRIQTGGGDKYIPWTSMQMLGVGIIELDLTVEMPRSAMRAMLRKLMGDDAQPNHQRRHIRETFLLDIYVTEQEAPLRIDSSVVNYRSLLGEASYQSMRNFLRLLQKIAKGAPTVRLDSSAVALLIGRRYDVKRYSSVYEFEMESHINRSRLDEQTLCSTIVLREEPIAETSDASGEAKPSASREE